MQATVKSLGIDRLSVAERIRLVEEIWDTIADEATLGEIPQWHQDELDRRLAEEEPNPEVGMSWVEAQAHLLNRLSKPKT